MLNIIIGERNSGKTHHINNSIKKLIEASPNSRIFLIVAEQCTFATVKNMLNTLGEYITNKIDVISFSRILNMISNSTGKSFDFNFPDSISKAIVTQLVLNNKKNDLKVYSNYTDKPEMLKMLLDFISEMNANAITYEEIVKYSCEFADSEIGLKLQDVATIFSECQKLLQSNAFTPFDELTGTKKIITETDFFENSYVFIDTFSGFTMQELEIIKVIISQAKEITVTLTSDDEHISDKSDLFYRVKKTINHLTKFATDEFIPFNTTKCTYEPNFQSDDIKFFANNIFRFNGATYDAQSENIQIYNSENYREECEYVATTISNLVKDNGYKYSDFALIIRDNKNYESLLDMTLKKHKIPYFSDMRQDLNSNPAVILTKQIFKIISTGYSSDEIFTYLKTGLTGIDRQAIAEIENYTYMWSIDKKDWTEDFCENPRGFGHKFTDEDKSTLLSINSTRRKIIEPFIELKQSSKNLSATELTEKLYDFLLDLNLKENLLTLCRNLKENGQLILAKQELRTWSILVDVINKIYCSLQNQRITIKMYSYLVETAFSFADIASIPQSLDSVSIVIADRNKGLKPKIAFVMGLNEGDFPNSNYSSGILSNYQREKLIERGLNINSNIELLSIEEQFIAYETVSLPTEKLFLSYVNYNNMLESKNPSSIIREAENIFPSVIKKKYKDISLYDLVCEPIPTFELTSKLWNDNSEFSETLKNYFKSKDEYKNKIKAIEFSLLNRDFKFELNSNAKSFFSTHNKISTSQIERYYSCPFSYFCRYGLNAKERKKAEIDALTYGNIIHYVLEKTLSAYSLNILYSFTYNELSEIIEKFIDEYIDENLSSKNTQNKRFKAQARRWVHNCCVVLKCMLRELMQSDFKPIEYEATIGSKDIPALTLDVDSSNITISGKIDRIDQMKKNGKNFVRIIDYKTGSKDFNLSDILYGINIQMFVYMTALLQSVSSKYKNIIPAGILYVSARKPVNKIEDRITIKQDTKKYLDIKGVVLDNDSVIDGMDKGRLGVFMPFKYDKDKKCKSNASLNLLNKEQMKLATDKIQKLICDMFINLNRGDISAVPTKSNEFDSCSICPYKPICKYEDSMKCNTIHKLSLKDALKELECDDTDE